MALDLTSQSTKDFILERTQEAVKYDDKHAAQEILKIFREELPSQQEQVAGVPGLYDMYKKSWVTAQFICLASIAEDDFFDLIREHLVDGLKIPDYDIIDKIGLRISFIILEAEQVTFMDQLLGVLKKNSGVIGTQNIKVAGRTSLPMVANWLADYDTYPSKEAQRSDYEQIAYVSKSPNAQLLTEEDKQVLLDVLDCYDSLRNLLAYYRSMPEAPEELLNQPENLVQFFPGANLVDSIPEEDAPQSSVAKTEPALVSKPSIPTPPLPEPAKTPIQTKEPALAVPAVDAVKPVPVPKPLYEVPAELDKDIIESAVKKEVAQNPAAKPKTPQESYIVEEKKVDTQKEEPRKIDEEDVAEQIKNNLRGMNIQATRAPLNVQDFLNERHNKGNVRGGIVFDKTNQTMPQQVKPVPESAQPAVETKKAVLEPLKTVTPTTPPANLPVAVEPAKQQAAAPVEKPKINPEEEIAKKLEELRKRKKI